MFPVLFKLEFHSTTMQLVALAIIAAFTAYGAWAGWNGAARREAAPYRAVTFGAGALILICLGASFAFPPMSEALLRAFRVAILAATTILVVAAYLFGARSAPKGSGGGTGLTYAVMGLVVGLVALSWGFGKEAGRGLGLPVHNYGLSLALAFIIGLGLAAREAARAFPEKVKVDGKWVPAGPIMREAVSFDLAFWILVGAIAGARLLFIIVNWKDYAAGGLASLLSFNGLVFYGGFIGAIAASVLWCRARRVDFFRIADVMIPSVALGHAIGRIGCFCAGCCWGGFAPEGSSLAVRFPSAEHAPFGGFGAASAPYQDQLKDDRWVDALGHVHDHVVAGAHQISAVVRETGYSMPVFPTQLMESVGELALFAILIFMRRAKWFHGQLLGTWLMGYALLRGSLEFFRGDVARGYLFKYPAVDPVILSTSQTISLAIFAAGVALFALKGRRGASLLPAA